jgi:hypothetical protein
MRLEAFIDEYGQIRHHEGGGVPAGLALAVAEAVTAGPLVMSWVDGYGTRLTLTLALPTRIGCVPGFGPDAEPLYVGVEGFGCYGFAVRDEPLHPDYIAEKFAKSKVTNPTWIELALLLGSVRQKLAAL